MIKTFLFVVFTGTSHPIPTPPPMGEGINDVRRTTQTLDESLQDTSVYDSQQKSMGMSISVPLAGPGGSISGNASHTNINSNYASVVEQSGIKAGDGGYKVNVKGSTDLKGAVIAASDEGLTKSTFKTGGTLTQSDIQNSASYNAEAEAVSAGVGSVASASAGLGEDKGQASATTKSGIGVSTKTDTTGAITKIFDANKVTDEVNAQVQITQTFSQLAPKAVGDYATTKLKEASDKLANARDQTNGLTDTERAQLIMDAKALDDNWGEGGAARVALHTVVGALGGGLNGAMGAGTVAVSTPEVAKIIDGMDVPEPMKQALLMATSTVIGEVAGGNAGAASGLTEVTNNYLNHQQVTDKTKELANCKARGCSAEERNSILQKYQSISDKNNSDGFNDVMAADGSVMPKYKLDQELSDLNAMVTGPTACAADLGCRIEVSKSISEIKEIQSAPETIQTFFNTVPNVMLGMTLPIVGDAALEAMGLGSGNALVFSETSALQRIAANNSVDTGSALRMARIDELSTTNYNKILAQDIAASDSVYRAIPESMIDIYRTQGGISGRGGSATYFSLEGGATPLAQKSGAQLIDEPQVLLKILKFRHSAPIGREF